MAKILFLAHRTPFPPNKGDKIRAFNLLRHLAARHDVWLGAGVDEAEDFAHAADAKALCRDVCMVPLTPARRAWNMARAAMFGQPLSVARFHHPTLDRWVGKVLSEVKPDLVFVYSSAAARPVLGRLGASTRLLVDFVDADAQKWRDYARKAAGLSRWFYATEARRLVAFERPVLAAATAGVLISETERQHIERQAPEAAGKLHVICNGVDVDDAGPAQRKATGADIVFCGRMDYEPNIDGAVWFARHILPLIHRRKPDAIFRIVGAAPVGRVLALRALPGVVVTGTVPDVRPYLAAATVIVAPLRIARGVQNKVLEGLAAGRPVVATPAALDGIGAQPGRDLLVAEQAEAFSEAVSRVLLGEAPSDLGARGRRFVLDHHRWAVPLRSLDALIDAVLERSSQAAA